MNDSVELHFDNGFILRFPKSEFIKREKISFVFGRYANQLSSYYLMRRDMLDILDCLKKMNQFNTVSEYDYPFSIFIATKYARLFTESKSVRSTLNANKIFNSSPDFLPVHEILMSFRNSYLAHADYTHENCIITLDVTKKNNPDGTITYSLNLQPHLSYSSKLPNIQEIVRCCEFIKAHIESKIEKLLQLMIEKINDALATGNQLTDQKEGLYIQNLTINRV